MKKIHCLNAIASVGTDIFDENYELTDNINEADAIMVRSAAMGDMEFSKNLLAIARAGAGVNNIPLDKCADAGIVVFNTPGANANGVKELVICGMLLAARDVVGGIEWTRSIKDSDTISKDVEKGKKNFAGGEIKGKKLGVIGLGAIGAEVANAAASLGLEVLGYDPYISVNSAWRLSRKIKHITDINEIFKDCDYITLHVPLTNDNKGMIGKDSIAEMKDGVVILNFARDLLVDDDEMEKALESGKVARYVTDFPNTKSAKMEKAIVIPHLGASTQESEDNCAVMAANELVDYLENGNIKNSVNFPSCDMGVCQAEGRVAILHKNIPNMIGQITSAFAKNGYNISDLTNKSKASRAYTLIDIESKASEKLVDELNAIDGVLKVRVIK
ncbi:3-phosphoglycerate dehydrogenase [Lachnoanaerobaculum orale]|uniref:D-3-phosphoglycerate dehydrogenase n=1 Tax=Lachnoanaerobaculum orale TaxID=979627 RepID=A0A3P3PZL1_9FIRM|nr:phosphoglycerate dehydrogenase [Lachnoanaerobaculum orale]RRJ14214.1 3-phosphoglycerate dehydrogenase [Lachnoanaerobaculum orale]